MALLELTVDAGRSIPVLNEFRIAADRAADAGERLAGRFAFDAVRTDRIPRRSDAADSGSTGVSIAPVRVKEAMGAPDMASRFYSGIDSRERSESRERGSGMLGLVPCMQTSGSQGRQPIEGRVEKGPLRELFHLFSGEPGGRERGASGQGADSSEPTRPVFSDKVNESSRIVSEIRRLNERLESKPDRVSGSSTVCATGSGSVRERSSGGEPWRQRKVEENTKQTAENTKMLIEQIRRMNEKALLIELPGS